MKKDKNETEDILQEAIEMLLAMDALGEKVNREYEQAMRYDKEFTDEVVERMSWEEREKHIAEVEALWESMGKSVEELQRLNVMYERIRVKAKDKYGKDVMPPQKGFTLPGLGDEPIDMVGGGGHD